MTNVRSNIYGTLYNNNKTKPHEYMNNTTNPHLIIYFRITFFCGQGGHNLAWALFIFFYKFLDTSQAWIYLKHSPLSFQLSLCLSVFLSLALKILPSQRHGLKLYQLSGLREGELDECLRAVIPLIDLGTQYGHEQKTPPNCDGYSIAETIIGL